jgi:probable F420-dependent oxidoreductase
MNQQQGTSRGISIGVVFPQAEIGVDPGAIRDYAQRVEELGFSHLLAYEHVLGADPSVHQGWTRANDVDSSFHEPLVLFGFLAAVTTTLELVNGVLVLPQRQTALVAKQAAEVDVLSGGRLRLGVGIGWNSVEYEGLGQAFTNRGKRIEEQIELLRLLWTERSVTFAGHHHTVTGAGIAPLPIQRPIPVWMGAASEAAYNRAGRLADGWFPMMKPGPELDEAQAIIRAAARASGRDPAAMGMQAQVFWTHDIDGTAADIDVWNHCGATHVAVSTADAGLKTVDDHLAVLEMVADRIGLR